GCLALPVELFEARALLLPMARLALLDDEQDREREADRDARDPLDVEEAQDHWPSASIEAPSRLAASLNRPTGPPARSPTITAIIAAMKPPSDQPKMVTMLCSSDCDQPPHISNATMATAQAPQNMPAA